MNIFTPSERAGLEGHPVLVSIFGGQFERGSPNYYSDINMISENFSLQGIIFIAINHRLAAFDLFSQAIHFSGSIFSQFALYERVVNESFALATQLGCAGTSSAIKSCLKQRSVADFHKAYDEIGLVTDRLLDRRFYPRHDGVFFPASFEQMLKSAPVKPTLAGLTSAEASDWIFGNKQTRVSVPVEKRAKFGRNDLLEIIDLVCRGIDGLCEDLTEFYATTGGDSVFYLTKLTQLVSDIAYNIPVIKEMSMKVNLTWPVFLYVEEYYSPLGRENVPIEGAFHGNEIDYLFGAALRTKFAFDKNDRHFQRSFLGAVTSFVKTGQPQVDSLPWKPATSAHPQRHMRFGLKNTLSNEYFAEETEFWLNRQSPSTLAALFSWEIKKHPKIATPQSQYHAEL